jgi:hypothetical protein
MLVTSNPTIPQDITPNIAEIEFGRFLRGEYDGLLGAYVPYLEYLENQNVIIGLRSQYDQVVSKLEELESATDEGRIDELTNESISVGGFSNLLRVLGQTIMEKEVSTDQLMIDRNGKYNGPVPETAIGRGGEALLRAMANMYSDNMLGYPDGVSADVWRARAVQRAAGDPFIPPMGEAEIRADQMQVINEALVNVDSDAVFLGERQFWVDTNDWVSTQDFNSAAEVQTPLVSPVSTERVVEDVSNFSTNSYITVNDTDNPAAVAIDAIIQAEMLGHDTVVVNMVTDEANSNSRPGITIKFNPINEQEARNFAASFGLSNVQLIRQSGEERLGMISGFTWTHLPELNPTVASRIAEMSPEAREENRVAATNLLSNAVSSIFSNAAAHGTFISEVTPELHDPLVITSDQYGNIRS